MIRQSTPLCSATGYLLSSTVQFLAPACSSSARCVLIGFGDNQPWVRVFRNEQRISLMKLFKTAVVATILAAEFTGASGAEAASGVNIGALNCTVSGGIGLLLGSSKGMNCIFHPVTGPPEDYTGSVTKLGIDIGITGRTYIAWAVFAPGKVNPGSLEGSYSGASAEASLGSGLGANVLIGGSRRSIALQPVSVQGQTGLNIAAGVARMDLEYVGP